MKMFLGRRVRLDWREERINRREEKDHIFFFLCALCG
jgi:hypothetical protein